MLITDHVGLTFEQTYGSVAKINGYAPVKSLSLDIDRGNLNLSDSLFSKLGTPIYKQGLTEINGTVDAFCYPDFIGYFLKSMLGTCVSGVASGETTVYTHNFSQAGSSSFTLIANEATGIKRIRGCVGKSLRVSPQADILTNNFEFSGADSDLTTDFYGKCFYQDTLTGGQSSAIEGTLTGTATLASGEYLQLTSLDTNTIGNIEYTKALGQNYSIFFDSWAGLGTGGEDIMLYWNCSTTPTSEADLDGYGLLMSESNDNFIQLYWAGSLLDQYYVQEGLDNQVWRSIHVEVSGVYVRVYIDSVLAIDYTDVARTPAGNLLGVSGRNTTATNEHRIKNFGLFEPFSYINVEPFKFSQVNIRIGNTEEAALVAQGTPVDEWSWGYSTEVIPIRHIGSKVAQKIKSDKIEVEGTLRKYLETADFEDYVDDLTTKALVIDIIGDNIGNGENYKLQIIMPQVLFKKVVKPYEAGQHTVEEVSFKAIYNEAKGYTVRAVLTNLIESY